MDSDTAKLLVKALLLFNDKQRFVLRRGGLDSYVVAHEITQHLKAHGLDWLDPELQPPPARYHAK
jgi:hypothetical protein